VSELTSLGLSAVTEALEDSDGDCDSFGLDTVVEILDGIEAGSTSFGLSAGAELFGGIGGLMRLATEAAGGGLERFGELACDGARLGAGSSINMPLIGSNR